jgi:hypothetical protein
MNAAGDNGLGLTMYLAAEEVEAPNDGGCPWQQSLPGIRAPVLVSILGLRFKSLGYLEGNEVGGK